MKRSISLILLIFMIPVILSGCISWKTTWKFMHSADKVGFMAIYYDLPSWQELDFPIEQDPVCYISENDFQSLMDDISNLKWSTGVILLPAAVDPSFYFGDYTLMIVYDNGDFEMISNGGMQVQKSADGKYFRSRHYGFPDDTDWLELLEQYSNLSS